MWVELDDDNTKCGICITKFSTDKGSTDENIRKHLPVLSSSQRCDHWFCHGCILREQQRVAKENNGRWPTWLKCMHCEEERSFCPEAPKYHRLLIDLLSRAYEQLSDSAQVQVEEEQIYEPSLDNGCNRATDLQIIDQYPKRNHVCIKEEPGLDERPNAGSFSFSTDQSSPTTNGGVDTDAEKAKHENISAAISTSVQVKEEEVRVADAALRVKEEPGREESSNAVSTSTDQSSPVILESQSPEKSDTTLDKDISHATNVEMIDEDSKKIDCAAMENSPAFTEEVKGQNVCTAAEIWAQAKGETEEDSTIGISDFFKEAPGSEEGNLDALSISIDETSPLNLDSELLQQGRESIEASDAQSKGDTRMCSACQVTKARTSYYSSQMKKGELARCKDCLKARGDVLRLVSFPKSCFVCKIEKTKDKFSNNQLAKGDGAWCKVCTKAYSHLKRRCCDCVKEMRRDHFDKVQWAMGNAAVCIECIDAKETLTCSNHVDADIEEVKHHQNASEAVEISVQLKEEEQEEATLTGGNLKRNNADVDSDHIDSRGAKRHKVSDTTILATSVNDYTVTDTLAKVKQESDKACNVYPSAQIHLEEDPGVDDTANDPLAGREMLQVCPVCEKKKMLSSFFSSHLATQGDSAACKVCVKEQLEAEPHVGDNKEETRVCYACKVAKNVKQAFTQINLQWGQLALCKKCTALQHTVNLMCSCCNTEKPRAQFNKVQASKKVVGTAVCHMCIGENEGIVCFCCKKKKSQGNFFKDEFAKGDTAFCMKCFNEKKKSQGSFSKDELAKGNTALCRKSIRANQKVICIGCKVEKKSQGDFGKYQLTKWSKGEPALCRTCTNAKNKQRKRKSR